MRLDPWILLTILSMALAAYACRGGGYWVFSKMRPSAGLKTFLSYVPGALFISFVVPAIAAGGLKEWIGAAVAVAIAIRTRSLTWPIFAGTAAAWAAWLVI